MTQCNPCNITAPLPICMAVLTVGDTTFNATAMYVYIKNHTTGVTNRFDVTTSAAGLLTIDLTDYPQIEGHDYELWATLASATNSEAREEITISAVAYTCFALTFFRLLDEANELITGEDQTLAII